MNITRKLTLGGVVIFILLLYLVYTKLELKSEFYNGIELTGKEIISGDSLGFPVELLLLQNHLIILDESPIDAYQIKVFSLNDYSLIASGVKNGIGPG